MPFNGTDGTFTLSDTIAAATLADANELQAILTDAATALSNVVCQDGQTPITAQLKGFVSANPGHSFNNDLNTGFGSDTADEAYVMAGGAKSFNVTATGAAVTGTLAVSGVLTGAVGISGATVAGAMVASKADMEAASATNKIVPPALVRNAPGVAKAWGHVAYSGGTPSLVVGHGVSIADNGVGNCRVTLATPSGSTATYIVVPSFAQSLSVIGSIAAVKQSGSVFDIITGIATAQADTNLNTADVDFSFVVYGDE